MENNHAGERTYADGAVISSPRPHFEGTANRVEETCQGTKGRTYLSAGNDAVLWDTKGNELYRHPKQGNANPYEQEHVAFFDAITKGEYKFENAEYGAYSTLTGIIGRLATYSGQVIKWEDALKSNIDLMPERYAWDAMPKIDRKSTRLNSSH